MEQYLWLIRTYTYIHRGLYPILCKRRYNILIFDQLLPEGSAFVLLLNMTPNGIPHLPSNMFGQNTKQ